MNLPYPPVHYYQNQGMISETGPVECVTTSVVMVMNMVKDRIAQDLKLTAMADISVTEYVAKLDKMGIRYRVPSDFFLKAGRGWMHPVLQVPAALKQFGREIKQKYNYSFVVKQSSGNSLEDISQNLQDGNFVLVHGLWQVTNRKEVQYTFGGFPHTMVAVEVDQQADKVRLLNPAKPHPKEVDPNNPATIPVALIDSMPTQEFMAFWGRKSILNLYTRPYTMTVLIPDTHNSGDIRT